MQRCYGCQHSGGPAKAKQDTVPLQQLRGRFGALSPETLDRVRSASLDELMRWTDRILDARTLDDVFG